jgi:Ankyrin repeats (3 copies)
VRRAAPRGALTRAFYTAAMNKTLLLLLPALLSFPLRADEALGTLTVKGKTTILKEVAAAEQADPASPADHWLVILASDRPVAGERTVARLTELARDGKLHAVRILWRVGTDTVRAVPYDAGLPQSGRMGLERPTIDLKRYGKGRVDAEFRSKMVGQDWHFHANVKASVTEGGVVELEPEAEEPAEADAAAGAKGAGSQKVTLGKLGYEYTDGMFVHAVSDGNLDAVRLFLQIGMSPNAHEKGDPHPMLHAAQLCSNQPESKPRSEILEALVAAHGDVKAKDENASTPLLWAVQTGCSPSAVRALLKAGADPNAKAKAGATPLFFAEIFQRKEIADILRAAGGKK